MDVDVEDSRKSAFVTVPTTVAVRVPAVQVRVFVPAEYTPILVPESVTVPDPVNEKLYDVANVVTFCVERAVVATKLLYRARSIGREAAVACRAWLPGRAFSVMPLISITPPFVI